MPDSPVQAQILRAAVTVYLATAYPDGQVPGLVRQRMACWEGLAPEALVPDSCFEISVCGGQRNYILRLGQAQYPHMKLVVEACPNGGYLFRADAHDSHLHAPPNSPDAGPLTALRARNKELTEAIEAAWTTHNIPTFRDYLRKELERRKCR